MDAAFHAVEHLNQEADQRIALLRLELQQAEYEADRAFRQYNHAEPENRLAVATLEANWNRKLEQAEAVKGRIVAAQMKIRPLTAEQKDSLLRIADDLPRIWNASSTTMEIRKRIVRAVLEEAVVDVDIGRCKIILDLHWKGGVHTHLEVRKNHKGEHRYCTDQELVDLVRQLASQMPDAGIVPILNKLGYKTGHGNSWTGSRVRSLRNSYEIATFDPKAPRTWLTLQQAARRLEICDQSVRNLIREGIIVARQVISHAPWCIEVEESARQVYNRLWLA